MQIGLSVSCWTIVMALASRSASSVSGTPMLMSSTSAPPSTCALTSRSMADRSPARSWSWKIRRPVGLIRSPIRQKRVSWPMTTCWVAERRTVSSRTARVMRGHEPGAQRAACGVLALALLVEERLGPLDGLRGVGGVPVGADRVGVLLGDRGTADHHDHVVADPGLRQRVHVGLEHRHRGGEERREADDVRLVLLDRGHELLGRHLDAEVDHLEAGPLEHDVDEVLADVVDVALDRAHQELADRLDAGLGEQRAQHLHGAGHRATGDQHLGHEEVAALEPRPDLLERGDERVEQHGLRLHLQRQALVGQLQHAGALPISVSSYQQDLVGGRDLAEFHRESCDDLLVGATAQQGGELCGLVQQVAADLVEPPLQSGVGPEMPSAAITSPLPRWTGTATPVSPTSSSSVVAAQPRLRTRCASRRRSSTSASVASVSLSSGPVGSGSVVRVEDLAQRGAVGRHVHLGPVAGAEHVAESTWATCTTRSPRGTLMTVSWVSALIRSMVGRASRTSSSHGSWRAAYSQNSRPAT